jgi:glycosyltransferase involved in cell wall biosynthesis
MFDEAFYLSQNPEVISSNTASLYHFIVSGGAEGRNPNRWFDTRWYIEQNPEVAQRKMNPLVHYLQVGAPEGKRPRPLATESETLAIGKAARKRVIFVSGEPGTPGHRYRVVQLADSLPPQFFDVSILEVTQIPSALDEINEADLVWVWRARRSRETDLLLAAHKNRGFTLLYDVDDLMFLPELATSDIIDGIRAQNMAETHVRTYYEYVKQLLLAADCCTTPTLQLAQEIRELNRPATVIPNGFDRRALQQARRAVYTRTALPGDGLVRIGYAAGTLTHQRDFGEASHALAAILSENSNTRLVLFRRAMILEEFRELEKVQDQIEWRDLVSLDELPFDYARFDINIAPLEIGNRFCESKSELKYFEAALVGVPTIASPVGAYAASIRPGENGFLANDRGDWYRQLHQLVSDASLRARIAETAYRDALWQYGPERRQLLVTRLVNQMLSPAPIRYELFRSGMQSDAHQPVPAVAIPEYDVLFQSSRHGPSRVSVVVPVFNYRHYIEEALDSLLQQTLHEFEVVVVDDHSTDGSAEVAHRWLKRYASRFNMAALLQNRQNSKLGRARNAGVSFCDTELYMPLDADNALLPDCLELCMRRLDETGAAFAYPTISMFGERSDQIGLLEYDPARFQCINYIDAMALVRKACWLAVGGYTPLEPMGWEDYEFWCKLLEKGLFGVRVPETTARYRCHPASMLRTITEVPELKRRVIDEMNRRHPWLGLRAPALGTGILESDCVANKTAQGRS